MRLLSLTKDCDLAFRAWGLGCVSTCDYQTRMWIDQVPTLWAKKLCFGDDRLSVKNRSRIELFLQRDATSWAVKLSIQSLLFFGCWCKLIAVLFDEPPRQFGVHLFDDTHSARLPLCPLSR